MSIKNEIVRWYVLLFKADSSENKRMYQGEFFLFDCLRHVCVCFLKKKNYLTTAEFQQIVRIWRRYIYMISTNCVHSCYMWRHLKVSFSVNICINFILHATLQLCPYCHVFISRYCIAVVFHNFVWVNHSFEFL